MKTGGISIKQPEKQAKLISQRHLSLADASEHASLQSWLPIEFQQLSPGSFAGSYQELALGEQLLVRESHNQAVHKRGVMAPEMCTVSFQRNVGPRMRMGEFGGHPLSEIFILPAGTELDVQAAAGCEIVYARFDQQQLFDAARVIDEERWSLATGALAVFLSTGRDRLDGFFDGLFRMAANSDQQRVLPDADHISSLIIDNVLVALDQSTALCRYDAPDYRSRSRSNGLVSRTREYIDANPGSPSMVDLCASSGASGRVLEYAFREVMGMSPMAYLRIVRLNRVRAALRVPKLPSLTVTQAATHWGFFHLGRFAADYQRMFDEPPSETLRLATA